MWVWGAVYGYLVFCLVVLWFIKGDQTSRCLSADLVTLLRGEGGGRLGVGGGGAETSLWLAFLPHRHNRLDTYFTSKVPG